MRTVVLEGRAEPTDRARSAVLQLPFEVPPGTTRIDVAYRYDAGHVLDLGLADVRFAPFPSRGGFRGWSGGARRRAFVATDEATPGYLAGPIPAGRWCVLLGLARLDGPCAYRVDIELSDRRRPTAAPPAPLSAARRGPGWFAGDLQSHTHHSDARGSLAELAAAAAARGLDFVAVTDHNTVSHHREILARTGSAPLLIPGEEVTTYRGHANVWGAEGWVDFRAYDDATMARVVDDAHARGGLFSVNHPKAQPGCIGCDWEYDVPADADAFEAWQGPWPNRNWESLERYDALLSRGRRLTLVGGSDRHQPALPERDPDELRVGSPTTWVYAEDLSVAGVLAAVRSGRACVSESPDGPRLDVSAAGTAMGGTLADAGPPTLRARVEGASPGDTLRWITPDGVARSVPVEEPSFEDAWTPRAAPRFVRAEILAGDAERRSETWRAYLGEAAAAGVQVRAPLRELREAHGRPWIRCLSNPLYGPDAGGASVRHPEGAREASER